MVTMINCDFFYLHHQSWSTMSLCLIQHEENQSSVLTQQEHVSSLTPATAMSVDVSHFIDKKRDDHTMQTVGDR